MGEVVNELFVFDGRATAEKLASLVLEGLQPAWQVLGQPALLMKLNVSKNIDERTTFDENALRRHLELDGDTIINVRAANNPGTVQIYRSGPYLIVNVSRPLSVLSPAQQRSWLILIWKSVRPYLPLFAVSGREAEISEQQIASVLLDISALRSVPLVDLAVVAERVSSGRALSAEIERVDTDWLIVLNHVTEGGSAVH